MSLRTVLAQKYIEHIQGTKEDELIKMAIGTQEPKSKDYLLGAERMTIKVIAQLQDIHASDGVLMLWSQVLARISYEIEQMETFAGKE